MWHCWAFLPVCYNWSPTQLLLLLKGGGVPSWRKAGLTGPHPRSSQMTGQHTEASSPGRRAGSILSSRLASLCLEGLSTLFPCPFLV